MTMQPLNLQYLFLVPVGLGLAFMLWVLWNFTVQLSRRNDPTEKRSVILIRVGERYALVGRGKRNPRLKFESLSHGISGSGASPSHPVSREYFQTLGDRTPGVRLRQKPSSTIQGAHK
jgi:hypothetical protein